MVNLNTNLSIFVISHTESIINEPKIAALLSVATHHEGQLKTQLDLDIGVELHGQTSLAFAKKSYGLKIHGHWFGGSKSNTRNSSSSKISSKVVAARQKWRSLGLPDCNRLVLHGPYVDKSLMRNALALELGYSLGLQHSPPRFVELVMLRRNITDGTDNAKSDSGVGGLGERGSGGWSGGGGGHPTTDIPGSVLGDGENPRREA
jgi:hypothetical protein